MISSQKQIYLDYAASTPVDPRVAEVMQDATMRVFGNASSIHGFGLQAKKILDETREIIASYLGAKNDEVFFTSGGTESNNLAIQGIARHNEQPGHIITSAIEHPSILETCRFLKKNGWDITFLPANKTGVVNPDELADSIHSDTVLVSIQHVNNEIGSINSIQECAMIAWQKGIPFHTDAVQSFGKLPIDLHHIPASLLSFTGHKIYGVKGAGVLIIRRKTRLDKLMHGGAQENKMRSGTENIPAIAALGKAVQLLKEQGESDRRHMELLGQQLRVLMQAKIPKAILNGSEKGVPNIQNYAIPGIDNMSLLMGMDLAGVAISNGSACSSGSVSPSHVLQALHLPGHLLKSSFRISFGRFTTAEEIEFAVEKLAILVQK
ncbi:cysteine desulfurase [candidate division KSB1 bacterium]|nr:cysteine desulfurase [candidate division KSB1 bacterium]